MKSLYTLLKIISIVLVVIYGLFLFILSKQIAGYRVFVVQSASMEPTIQTGSLIVTQKINPYNLVEQDIVTFIRPDNTTEFVTHRISSVSKSEEIPLFKTKGDNNDSDDTWTLVGGGVVGKMLFSVPYLGYIISLARTKISIALFILVPASFIIIDEIKMLISLIKNKKNPDKNKQKEVVVPVTVLILMALTLYSIGSSRALLSNSVTLANNSIIISPEPSITPAVSPTPTDQPDGCPDIPDIIIEGNGSGSQNDVSINIVCKEKTLQSNKSDIENYVEISTQDSNTQTTIIINNVSNSNVSSYSAGYND